jgi:ferric-dicitrate binding protein FerR (iron transport regulator)
MTKRLDRAASVLLRHVDASADMNQHAALRARVVERSTLRRSSSRPVIALWVLAPVAVALAVVVLMFAFRGVGSTADITFAVAGARRSVGEYLVTVDGAPQPIQFSEGSVVVLQPLSRGRVSSVSRRGASILLESGRARCDIVHRDDTDWSVTAGPYSVQIRGTSFEIAWDTARSTLELQMVQGRVVLRGPGVESGIDLSGTQRFTSTLQARTEPSAPAACS